MVSFDDNFYPWIAAGVAALLMFILTPLVIRIAGKMGWVARPSSDRWHSRPTALMGGIAIFAAAAVALVMHNVSELPIWVMLGAAIMFVIGLCDDVRQVSPGTKLAGQVIGAGLLIYSGYQLGADWPLYLSVPLTVIWVIGITNALNLLDNMDGLAAGIALIAAAFLATFSLLNGSLVLAAIGASIVGATGGFLFFNFKPARIFMGDCGSMFLGYMIAALSVMVHTEVTFSAGLAALLIPVAVVAIPIFDTTLVTISRLRAGRRVSMGGRDHSSHRLVFLGLNERTAVTLLYAAGILFGLIGLLYFVIEPWFFYATFAFSLTSLGMAGAFLLHINVYNLDEGSRALNRAGSRSQEPHRMLRPLLARLPVIGLGVADILVIAGSYILAFYLRFEDSLGTQHEYFMAASLPLIIVAKLAIFNALGLYRGVWRYAGSRELVRICSAVAVGGLVASLLVFLAFNPLYSTPGLMIIDAVLTLTAAVLIRFAFRALPDVLWAAKRSGRPILLYGAGDTGMLSLREMRVNQTFDLDPVGFLDDDPSKKGKMIYGLPVLGSPADLPLISSERAIDAVVITSAKLSEARRQDIWQKCQDSGLRCREFNFSIETMPDRVHEPVLQEHS